MPPFIDRVARFLLHEPSLHRIWACALCGFSLSTVFAFSEWLDPSLKFSSSVFGQAWQMSLHLPFALTGIGFVAFAVSLAIKWHQKSIQGMKEHAIKHLLESLIPTVVSLSLYFAFNLLWAVPHSINRLASTVARPTGPALSIPNACTLVPGQCLLYEPLPTEHTNNSQSQVDTLKQRTESLARDVVTFVLRREGSISSWKQDATVQAMVDALRDQQNHNDAFQARLQEYNLQTGREFSLLYWTQVQQVAHELLVTGSDVSPLTRATDTGDPRKIGLMLSAVADQIGKPRGTTRVFTPLEAGGILSGFGRGKMEIYGYVNDVNSMQVAETIRKEFARESWDVNREVIPLTSTPVLSGVHLVFPSPDWTYNFEGMIEGFKACELETHVDVRRVGQPPTIFKIEVWPQKEFVVDRGRDLIR